jgi:hypothetical protein
MMTTEPTRPVPGAQAEVAVAGSARSIRSALPVMMLVFRTSSQSASVEISTNTSVGCLQATDDSAPTAQTDIPLIAADLQLGRLSQRRTGCEAFPTSATKRH